MELTPGSDKCGALLGVNLAQARRVLCEADEHCGDSARNHIEGNLSHGESRDEAPDEHEEEVLAVDPDGMAEQPADESSQESGPHTPKGESGFDQVIVDDCGPAELLEEIKDAPSSSLEVIAVDGNVAESVTAYIYIELTV